MGCTPSLIGRLDTPTLRAAPISHQIRSGAGTIINVGLRSRLSWLINGPSQITRLEHAVQELQQSVAGIERNEAEQLAGIRSSVTEVLDDVVARTAAMERSSRPSP